MLSRAHHPVRAFGLARIAAAGLLLQFGVSACTTPARLAAVPAAYTTKADPGLGPVRFMVRSDPQAFTAEALRSLEKEKIWLAKSGVTGPLPPSNFLAISGGGDNGAFAAGLLNGWSKAGTRPSFKGVTGISTGALIAPFAFLGPEYDGVLRTVYTTISARDIFKSRGLVKGFMGDAMADSAPMFRLVRKYADRPLLDAIAAEYAKGRLLLVGTTDLDALEPVIWNMTAIAASSDPRALDLFQRILVASASIPGAFPPVMIDVTVGGVKHQEMHVDGGTMSQVFLYPPSLDIAEFSAQQGMERKRHLYIIRNARLDADWVNVPRRTLSIAARAISSLTLTQGVGDLYRIYVTANRDGIDYNLAYIPESFKVPHTGEFDTNYMKQLYDTAEQMAAAGYSWQKLPPGYPQPRETKLTPVPGAALVPGQRR